MEETEKPDQLIELVNWNGIDRIMFSSDYPHWDFDDPFVSLPPTLTAEQRNMIFAGNARALYRLDLWPRSTSPPPPATSRRAAASLFPPTAAPSLSSIWTASSLRCRTAVRIAAARS